MSQAGCLASDSPSYPSANHTLPVGRYFAENTELDPGGAPPAQDEMCKERPEMFVQGGVVRPGILVLVNDADWELCGGAEAEVEDGDEISFISTLHGG